MRACVGARVYVCVLSRLSLSRAWLRACTWFRRVSIGECHQSRSFIFFSLTLAPAVRAFSPLLPLLPLLLLLLLLLRVLHQGIVSVQQALPGRVSLSLPMFRPSNPP